MIETRAPAQITFPLNIANIIVVNNAVPQSPENGVECIVSNKAIEDYKLSKDSAVMDAVEALAGMIYESKYFNKTLIYNKPVRTDNEYLAIKPIAQSNVKNIVSNADADAVIALERLLFHVTQNIKIITSNYVLTDFNIRATGNFSAYLPDKTKPMATFVIQDSLKFYDYLYTDSLTLLKLLGEDLLSECAREISFKASKYFVPYWETSERILYTNSFNSQMKEALAYAKKDSWKEAFEIWSDINERETKQPNKANLLINIAISYEMRDLLDKALEMTDKAIEYYNQEQNKYSKELDFANRYRNILLERIKNTSILDAQLGPE